MNKVNGSHSCENENLLQQKLETELGFPGFVFPDVSGQHTALGSATDGEDYGSSIWSADTLLPAISNGSLNQEGLDDMAIRNVIGYYQVHLDDGLQPLDEGADGYVDVRSNHSTIVRAKAAASLVVFFFNKKKE